MPWAAPLPHPNLVWTFYSNVLVLFYVVVPLGLGILFATLWARVLGITFGPDVPYDVENRDSLSRELLSLGFQVERPELPSPAPVPPAPDPGGRRLLRMGLGALWIVSGLLVLQPAVGTGLSLPHEVAPVVAMLPPWLHGGIAHVFRTWQSNAIGVSVITVYLEVVLGSLLLAGVRAAPWLSAAIAALGWAVMEGFGGMFGGGSFLGSAPGTFGLYLVASILLLLPRRRWKDGTLPRVITGVVGLLWIVGAALQARRFWLRPDLLGLVPWASLPQMPLAAWPARALLHLAAPVSAPLSAGLVGAMAAFGALLLWKGPAGGWMAAVSATWLFAIWWATQDFGGLFTGEGTDPGTAVAWALLLGAAWFRHKETETPGGGRVRAAGKGGMDNGRAT